MNPVRNFTMKYKKLTGIILKKQNYREADQIVSCWTQEAGKVRILAKSLRKPASKLNYACQDLAQVELYLAGKHLPTLIGAKPVRQFNSLRTDLKKTAIAFYAAELMLKMTADEHPNPEAYNLLTDFFYNLDRQNYSEQYFRLLDSFCVELLEILGFKIPKDVDQLNHHTINKFIEYILERNIKSELFLISI